MRILIIANSKVVFGKELQLELNNKGFDVSLLDFEFLTMYDKNYNENTTFSELFRKYKSIPKFSIF